MIEDLNEQQRDALLGSFTQDTMVIAGAGSGKTRLITERICYLLDVKKVEPFNIVCITFTNKAAKELKERIGKACGEERASQIWIGTFHSICIRLLKMYGANIGLNKFTILDPYDAKKVMKSILTDLDYDNSKEVVKNYLDRISTLKNKLITPRDYRIQCDKNGIEDEEFIEAFSNYQKENLKNFTIDYDDIILYTTFLLSHSKEAIEFVQKNFKFVMVDETQDSNHSNTVLFKQLSKNNNLFLVFDLDQSIYGWRGAVPEYLIQHQNEYRVFKLEQNYRSTQKIVHASNMVVANNVNRIDKTCFSKNEMGDNITYSEFLNPYKEAEFIADEIQAYKKLGIDYNEIFILYRTNSQSRIFEEVFLKKGLPYTLIGSLSFTERKEIKDCIAYAKIKDNDRDKPAFLRVLKTLEGVGDRAIKDITAMYDVSRSIKETLAKYQPKTNKAFNSLQSVYNFVSNVNDYDALYGIISSFIAKYTIENTEDSRNRIENLNELNNLVKEKQSNNMSFSDFVNEMELMSSKDVENKTDSVSMLTVHASKGLEAKIVFLAGCNDGIMPHINAKSDEEKEEERRGMYVAMTRAKKKLYISSYRVYANRNFYKSPFINEIPKTCLEII